MKLLSFGGIYLDINATNFPIPTDSNSLVGTETIGSDYEMVLGGSALNVVRFCHSFGIDASFIGKTGNDSASEVLIKLFKKEGLSPVLISDSSLSTNLNTNIVSPHGTSLMLSFGNANQSLSSEDIFQGLFDADSQIDSVYIGGVFKLKKVLPSILDIAKTIKEQQRKLILDHGRIVNTATPEEKEIVRKLAFLSDIYLPSRDEFLSLWEEDFIEAGLKSLSKRNSDVLTVVKDAENGAWTIENGKVIHLPGFSVKAVNTIGAGDSFNAGFLFALSEGQSLLSAIRFANATAALKISQGHFPTHLEIEELLK